MNRKDVLWWKIVLFNIFIFSMLNNPDFANYIDDTTPYVIGDDAKEAIDSWKNALDESFCWFASNQVKANPDKCQLIAYCDN